MSIFGLKYSLMQGEGGGEGGDGGGGGGEQGDKGAAASKGNESSEMLMRGLAVVASGMSKLQESNEALITMLKEQAANRGGGEGGDKDKGGKGGNGSANPFEGVDMEQLDRPQFAAFLLSKFEERLQHHLEQAVKPVNERVEKVSTRLEEDMASREVQGASKDRPDFYEWKTEISAILKDNPGLNVVRAYNIARSENADKAKKMDEKYAPKKEPAGGGFSLTPTGGGGRGEGATKMKFNEAAEKAYNDVLASLGGVSLDQLPVVGGRH